MKANNRIDKLIVEESSEWIETLKRDNPEDAAAFGQWLLESKRHVRHFLMMTALDEELRHFDPEKKLPIPDTTDHSAHVVPFNEHTLAAPAVAPPVESEAPADVKAERANTSGPTRGRTFRWWSFAAVFLACLGALTSIYWIPGDGGEWQEFSTAMGEQRSVELRDGSLVHLNTDSHIAVRLTGNARDIRLLDGEALFKVHHDATRPFRVHTLGATIQAIGTQFNVYRRPDGATVSVVEGRVQISSDDRENGPANTTGAQPGSNGAAVGTSSSDQNSNSLSTPTRLAAGEEAKIDGEGRIEPQHNADVARSTAWRQRRLIFKQDSLGAIVTEFNRYNRVPQFKLVGTSVATRRYSGAFDADDPESLSALLASEPDLFVQRSGDEILVRARLETGAFANSP